MSAPEDKPPSDALATSTFQAASDDAKLSLRNKVKSQVRAMWNWSKHHKAPGSKPDFRATSGRLDDQPTANELLQRASEPGNSGRSAAAVARDSGPVVEGIDGSQLETVAEAGAAAAAPAAAGGAVEHQPGAMPAEAEVELKGATADGGLAMQVNFSQELQSDELPPELQARLHEAAAQGGESYAGQQGQPFAPASDPAAQDSSPDGKGAAAEERPPVPPLSIVIMVAGTRGDVQPFVALGLKLQEYGHKVRLASHAVYREFVTSWGLLFYPLGGDPKVLSDFIVKNRGIVPSTARDGYTNILEVESIVMSTYDACTKPDEEGDNEPFTAEVTMLLALSPAEGAHAILQAIIANPPAYGHIHCAEKMGIPLHMFFTMPWSPTHAFPQPLARLNHVEDARLIGVRNYLSYLAVDDFIWAGIWHIFNRFRTETLDLAPIRLGNKGPHLLAAHEVPFGYCWSSALVPKPGDWGSHIDVCGYFFLNEGKRMNWQPPAELADFMAAGDPPVYVGFGSLIVDRPNKVTQMIIDAAQRTEQRIILQKGWANLGEGMDLPSNIFVVDNTPHDWLFPRCSAVVHHGGAGTTAAGLIAASPTLIIPFFGDQSFWGGAVARRGVGPAPIPIDKLTTDKLAAAFAFLKEPSAKEAAEEISVQILKEDGLQEAMEAFHRQLPLEKMLKGEKLKWDLAKPHFSNWLHEVTQGVAGIVTEPIKGARRGGAKGAAIGIGKGLTGAIIRPLKGIKLTGMDIGGHAVDAATLLHAKNKETYLVTRRKVAGMLNKAPAGQEEGAEKPTASGPSMTEVAAADELSGLANDRLQQAEAAAAAEDEGAVGKHLKRRSGRLLNFRLTKFSMPRLRGSSGSIKAEPPSDGEASARTSTSADQAGPPPRSSIASAP